MGNIVLLFQAGIAQAAVGKTAVSKEVTVATRNAASESNAQAEVARLRGYWAVHYPVRAADPKALTASTCFVVVQSEAGFWQRTP